MTASANVSIIDAQPLTVRGEESRTTGKEWGEWTTALHVEAKSGKSARIPRPRTINFDACAEQLAALTASGRRELGHRDGGVGDADCAGNGVAHFGLLDLGIQLGLGHSDKSDGLQ